MDFRLTRAIHTWIEEAGMMNDTDIISIAGAGKVLSSGADAPPAKELIEQIALSKRLHDIKTVYLIHHTDCGAYGGHSAFETLEKEKQVHMADMAKEKQIIESSVSGVAVISMIADIHDDGTVAIERI